MKKTTFNQFRNELDEGIVRICQDYPKCSRYGLLRSLLDNSYLVYGRNVAEVLETSRGLAKYGMVKTIY